MATNKRTIKATADEIFEVLLDPECYPDWVVGAKTVPGQDKEWPAVGSSFYHRVGVEGANLKEKTTMLALEAPRYLELTAYARPLGIARITVRDRTHGQRDAGRAVRETGEGHAVEVDIGSSGPADPPPQRAVSEETRRGRHRASHQETDRPYLERRPL